MRSLVIASILVVCIACNKSNDQQEIKTFLTKWSNTIKSGDVSAIQNFYYVNFILPPVMYDLPAGLSYTLNMEALQIENGSGDSIRVNIPYHVTTTSGLEETNTITVGLVRTQKGGYFIFDVSPELAIKIKDFALALELQNVPPEVAEGDSLLDITIADLKTKYDNVVFYGDAEGVRLFYVIRGNWTDPYPYDEAKQTNSGDYKMGVVTADNRVIIPVEFDKIYNPNGSFAGMIEVEKDGKRGLYSVEGKLFLPVEYEGLYPVILPEVFAQVKMDGKYGWVSDAAVVSFDPSTNSNKNLFQSPLTSSLVSEWSFIYPGDITVLVPTIENDVDHGLIIYPSYLSDHGFTPIANSSVARADSQYGMGMEENTVRVEKQERISDKLYALVGFFMEAGSDARGYHTEKNDVFVVDHEGSLISTLPKLTLDESAQDPCGKVMAYKSIEPGFYETNNGDGSFRYFKVNGEGEIQELGTPRQYPFTKYVKIDESYFGGCRWEEIPWESRGEDDIYNVVVSKGLSYDDLDVMRNEIFAEYGFIFKSEKWKKYFESMEWYKPQYENVDQFMTETDKHNIKFILEYQKNHKGAEVERDSIQMMWAG